MLREFESPRLGGRRRAARTRTLALDAWDAKSLALRYAQSARTAGASAAAVGAIGLRVRRLCLAMRAPRCGGEAGCRRTQQALALAQALLVLGDDAAPSGCGAEVGGAVARLLAQVAIESGDYAVAEQRCLINDPNSAPLAVYYLALISGAATIRPRRATTRCWRAAPSSSRERFAAPPAIVYRQGERDTAVRILNAARGAAPDERIRAELAAADLLSVAGAADEAVSRIDSAQKRAPAISPTSAPCCSNAPAASMPPFRARVAPSRAAAECRRDQRAGLHAR